jgi:hypothetical protein
MPATRVLYFTAHQMVAYRWRHGECVAEGAFDSELPGTAFASYLAERRNSVFLIVANLAEEGFHHEAIPFLQSADRRTVVRRRLNQLFQGSPYTLDVSLGYEKTRRKNENILLLGLTSPLTFEPTIKALQAAEARLAAIHSLPLLSSALLARLKIAPSRCLLLTLQDNTIRQSYFDGGRLVLSRLAPLTDSSASGVVHAIGGEVGRFQQYLLSQRTIGRNDALDVHVLLHTQIAQTVAATLPGSDLLRFHVHDLATVAKALGARGDFGDSRCQALFAHMACAMPPRQQFAPPALRKEYRLWQTSRALAATGFVVLAGALLFAAKTWHEVGDRRLQAERQLAEAAAMNARYERIVATFPAVPVPKEVLRQVIGRYEILAREQRLPQDIMRELARALDQSPAVEIRRLDWAVGGDAQFAQKLPRVVGPDSEVLLVEGTIAVGSGGNARELLSAFESFTARLLGPPERGQEVLILQQPFDIASASALKSGGSTLATREARPFSLALVRKHGA